MGPLSAAMAEEAKPPWAARAHRHIKMTTKKLLPGFLFNDFIPILVN
jgi:hypothetical protein